MKRLLVTALAIATACLSSPIRAQAGISIPVVGGTTVVTAAKKLANGSWVPEHMRVDSLGVEKGTLTNPDSTKDVAIGDPASPAPGTVNDRLASTLLKLTDAVSALQTMVARLPAAGAALMPAGGSIGNTAFGISGTLPAFTAPPTFNLGTVPTGISFGSQCSVIAAGDPATAWTVGQPYLLPCTSTGRVRVGLSSAAAIGTTLAAYSDLAGYQAADGTQKPASLDTGGNVRVAQPASTFADQTVASLSAQQAAGTASIIAANPNRHAFAITPASDGKLCIGTGGAGFCWPLIAGITKALSGPDCPTNALYVTGQTAGTALPIAEG